MATPEGSNAIPVTRDATMVAVDIDVSAIATRLENEAQRLISDLSQQGLTGDALANAVSDGLRNLSNAPVDRAARGATGEQFNLGRNLAAQAQLPAIGKVVRTEILDENTCAPCRALDQSVYEMNSDAYFENMPPNKCDGWEQCRGFYIYMEPQ